MAIFINCNGEAVTGKVIIEYTGQWNAEITLDRETTVYTGTDNWEQRYTNPDSIKATVTKLDDSENKISLYIYEDGRIMSASSTRDAQGSITAEYEFPY